MANVIATEIDETKSAKSVKRVRFSDEIKRVDFYGESDDSGSLSLDNENASVSSEKFDDVSEDSVSTSPVSENNEFEPILEPEDDNNNELVSYPQNVTVAFPSAPQKSDTYENEFVESSDDLTSERTVEQDDSTVESPELMDLINETKLMAISPSKIAMLVPDSFVEEKECQSLSCRPDSESIDSQEQVGELKEKCNTPSSRKRSLEGILLEKQTSKLNSCLRKNYSEFSSAYDLKNAVYNAWKEVKSESSIAETHLKIPLVKKSTDACSQSASKKAYEMWKKSKIKSKKMNSKFNELSLHQVHKSKSKQDIEESKMAFEAWKKRKDEILKHQKTEKYKNEARNKSDSLVTEKMKRNEAESAYMAWHAHKSAILKLEKKKKQWFLEKEREKFNLKIKNSGEAYHEWLINKVYSECTNSHQIIEDKPPWTPPGKGSTLV